MNGFQHVNCELLKANGRTNEGVLEWKHEWFSKDKTLEERIHKVQRNEISLLRLVVWFSHIMELFLDDFDLTTRLHLYGAIRGGCVCIGNGDQGA